MTDFIRLDYESKSKVNLITQGLDIYSASPSTSILMAAWDENDSGDIQFWDESMTRKPSKHLTDILRDPKVIKWAFNAQFERTMTERVWGIKTPYSSWRCTMVLAYMMGFAGDLATVGATLGFDPAKLKDPMGKKLIQMFSVPRKPTKADPTVWRDALTNPDEWQQFGHYNRQDVRSEAAIGKRLQRFPVLESEWELYALDQYINDTGMNIDIEFCRNALALADKRKPQIIEQMKDITKVSNPNSTTQLLPWLTERGYPFTDLRGDTVQKVLRERGTNSLTDEAATVLQLRVNSSKTSLAKYTKMMRTEAVDGRFRFSIQMCGAQRTNRFGGRDVQPHNMPRTPKWLEDVANQAILRNYIMRQDLDMVNLFCGEAMDGLVGMIRSAITPSEGNRFVVSDLSSIESVVIGWITECKWFMDTLRDKRDIYMSFAAEWLKLPYAETKPHRSKAKPATLGAGFRLGGGDIMPDGKKTGLWAYAENMGVFMTRQEAHDSVNAFRDLCPEIVDMWHLLEKAVARCLRLKCDVRCGKVVFEYRKPFLCILLPSGRRMYYFKPAIVEVEKEFTDKTTGEVRKYKKRQFRYEGKDQGKNKWGVQYSHGGKLIENIVQAVARDILVEGMKAAHAAGFLIAFHVHDEIVAEVPIDDTEHSLDRLISLMAAPIKWAPGLPLGAAGWEGFFYRKD